MRTLHLWNRQDLKALASGQAFDFKFGEEIHTFQAEHAYRKAPPPPPSSNGTSRRHFTAAAMREAVKRLKKERAVDVAKDVGVSTTTIRTWAREQRGG